MKAGTSDLYTHLGYWHNRFGQTVRVGFERRLAKRGMTVSQWCFLIVLYHAHANTVKGIAEKIHLDPAAVTRLADRLSAKGYVLRVPKLNDGRIITFVLTDKGKELVPHLIRDADQNDIKYFGSLTAIESIQYKQIIQKLLKQCGQNMKSTNSVEETLIKEERLINNNERTFPETIRNLIGLGVERYYADLIANQKTYYLSDNLPYQIKMKEDTAQHTKAGAFKESELVKALRDIQAGNIGYCEFIECAKSSGVVSYSVYINGAQVHYLGKNGELYVEHFPSNS